MKTTLIIHPKDKSTTFLEVIYKDIENKTVVVGDVSRKELREMIKTHDRIIMCGHGSPRGLFAIGEWDRKFYGYVIGHNDVDLLKEKKDCYYIWCNADQFVNHHKLNGFYTGMFISEVEEANYFSVVTTQEQVDESNNGFSKILSNHINKPLKETYNKVVREYGVLVESNSVASYNHQRLYLKQ